MDRGEKHRELERLQTEVKKLEIELAEVAADWPPRSYYTAYHVLAGFVLGMFGAVASLLFNVVGSLLVGKYPLQLIRVYLTFPLGEAALETESGLTLAIGCCLYLGTGMLFGIPFHLVLSRFVPNSSFVNRFVVVSVLALALWLVNYYVLLSWLQPVLFGGNWIVHEVPWWVAALTHLVFGWTMLLVDPLGLYVPYRQRLEES